MLTQTSELAIKALLVLGLEGGSEPVPPHWLAKKLDCSESYLAKILGLLTKTGILRSVRGSKGGVVFAMKPEQISLLEIVTACQGLLIANYCQEIASHGPATCAFHTAMKEIHRNTINTLEKWKLSDIMHRPTPQTVDVENPTCKMNFQGCQNYCTAHKSKSAE